MELDRTGDRKTATFFIISDTDVTYNFEELTPAMKEIADMSAEAVSPEQIARISELLDNWDNISFEDRQDVADGMISQIKATNEDFDIVWKI